MNGHEFLRIVREAFEPFLREIGFSMGVPSISGRHYHVKFFGPMHVVSVSFEPGCDAQFVMILRRENDGLSDIDDRTRSPRLSDLNKRYMGEVSAPERLSNDNYFKSIVVRDEHQQSLLKAARELRLVLPRFLTEERSATISGSQKNVSHSRLGN